MFAALVTILLMVLTASSQLALLAGELLALPAALALLGVAVLCIACLLHGRRTPR